MSDTELMQRTRTTLKQPSKYKVVLFNDDQTTVEFVISVLMVIFNKSEADAVALTLAIHETGAGVAGVYYFEMADTKKNEAIDAARKNKFPLRVELQEIA